AWHLPSRALHAGSKLEARRVELAATRSEPGSPPSRLESTRQRLAPLRSSLRWVVPSSRRKTSSSPRQEAKPGAETSNQRRDEASLAASPRAWRISPEA